MILPKISLKKNLFVLILGSSLLLLFGSSFSNFEGWNPKTSNLQSHQLTINETHPKIAIIDKKVLYFEKHKHYVLRREPYTEAIKSKEWYFYKGERYPFPTSNNSIERSVKLFPEDDSKSDRIIDQLMFVPHNYQQIKEDNSLKTILLYNGVDLIKVKDGREEFLYSKCPVDTCTITFNREKAVSADMILYTYTLIPTGLPRLSKQIYMLYNLECPLNTNDKEFRNIFNWTATYRKDSDIVLPYSGKWKYYDNNIKQMNQERNYALNKTKKVAWFVSRCGQYCHNGRLQYAHYLQKYINVDIYGRCGTLSCPKSNENKCFEILDREYKFYLAFENSNCKDYITEKFVKNALKRNILPIVMGAPPEDYENTAPYRSYIHVDEFSSVKELADYLNILDKDDETYNSYFKWKGTGEFINTFFWCRVCALLHDDLAIRKPKWYSNINLWWKIQGGCIGGSWRKFKLEKFIK